MRLDAYDTPQAEALLVSARERGHRTMVGRERVSELCAAAGFLAAALALAVLAPWSRSLSLGPLVVMLFAFAVAYQVSFPVGDGWTIPTELVFIPMLFVLPTPVVPVCVGLVTIVARVPGCVRGNDNLRRIWTSLGDSWYAVAPAAVLVLAGHQQFAWRFWPLYAAAIVAQFVADFTTASARGWFSERLQPRLVAPMFGWIYIVDASLASVGLLACVACVMHPALILLMLPLIGLLAGFATERTRRLDQATHLSAAYRGTAMLLGDVVEADDAYTGSHSRGVLELSLAVADRLGLDAMQGRGIELGALLHDVGKVRVPKEIINKPGKLDEAEWSIIRRHTIEGEAMLCQVGGVLADVGRIVRSSHERYDGQGYPDGLAGDHIPLESRVICACDALSAMTTTRPYRRARLAVDALAEMRRCAGTQFDPHIVSVLCALVEDGLVDLPGLDGPPRSPAPPARAPVAAVPARLRTADALTTLAITPGE